MTMENEAPQKNSEKKSLLDSVGADHKVQSVQESSSLLISEEIENFFLHSEKLYELEDVIADYKVLNASLIDVMDRFMDIQIQECVYAGDVKYLSKFNLTYTKRRIRKSRKDNLILNYDIFSNVLNSTLLDAYEKSILFFESNNLSKWDKKLNVLRECVIKNGGKYVAQMIELINILYANLRNLYLDFNVRDDSFQANFDFNISLELSEECRDLAEKKAFWNWMILNCNKMCLSSQIANVNKDEQEEFIRKCQKAIEIVDFEQKLFDDSTASVTPVEVEPPASPKAIDAPITSESLPETDITLNRQFLALYYMLNAIDNQSFSRNKSEIARFIQMITGKSYHNIYKSVKNPLKDPSERTSKKYQDDIHFLVDSFRKLGLNRIALTIENDNLIG